MRKITAGVRIYVITSISEPSDLCRYYILGKHIIYVYSSYANCSVIRYIT